MDDDRLKPGGNMTRVLLFTLLLVLVAPDHRALAEVGTSEGSAMDEVLQPLDESGEPADCVSLAGLDRTEVVNDQTILFYMRGNQVYVNYLPRRCSGLNRRKAFSYKTSLNRLCKVDLITVLDTYGSGISRGASCGLGMFHPIGADAAVLLKEADEAGLLGDGE